MNLEDKLFYIGTLDQEQIDTLNAIFHRNEYPKNFSWDDYSLPAAFEDEIQNIINDRMSNGVGVESGSFLLPVIPYGGPFRPTPTKAPPPRYIRSGSDIEEIMGNYSSMNGNETLLDKNYYSFTIEEQGAGIKVVVNYHLYGYEIEDYDMGQIDILYDSENRSSSPKENKLVIMKLRATSTSAPVLSKSFTLPNNPKRLSIAFMKEIPISIHHQVKHHQKSFHIYPFKDLD